jgi:hypothetical protein
MRVLLPSLMNWNSGSSGLINVPCGSLSPCSYPYSSEVIHAPYIGTIHRYSVKLIPEWRQSQKITQKAQQIAKD